ncbi:hypothetical protein LTR84_007553 [Exophiala bonariae]|uniref:Uncharacterized protein n=1 Tax=Exophiala bonariae TaxID=1690606 RepID=A0AAV9NKU5_9EURO|nr:hypothetical protein LTR84_007553 [Exophiala bonariae]
MSHSSEFLGERTTPMPRDSLELVEQHAALLKSREKSKKRTRLRSRVLDEWKADKVYPQDKPASYNPTSPGRDVLSGGYRRSEYQIEVHSRDYARLVVRRKENHEAKDDVDRLGSKGDKDSSRPEKDELLPRMTTVSRQTIQRRKDSRGNETPPPKQNNGSKQQRREWLVTTNDEVSDLIVRFSPLKYKQWASHRDLEELSTKDEAERSS